MPLVKQLIGELGEKFLNDFVLELKFEKEKKKKEETKDDDNKKEKEDES